MSSRKQLANTPAISHHVNGPFLHSQTGNLQYYYVLLETNNESYVREFPHQSRYLPLCAGVGPFGGTQLDPTRTKVLLKKTSFVVLSEHCLKPFCLDAALTYVAPLKSLKANSTSWRSKGALNGTQHGNLDSKLSPGWILTQFAHGTPGSGVAT